MSSIHVGRRKTSVARASITRGSGNFTINGRELEDYFPTEKMRDAVTAPLKEVEQLGQWDVVATCKGGGTTGQSDALKLAIARALIEDDPQLRPPLKAAGMLTRDDRKVERKKYGLKKARRAPQFSKR